MASSWSLSWLRSWRDTWGSLAPVNYVEGAADIVAIANAECLGSANWKYVGGSCEAIATMTTVCHRERTDSAAIDTGSDISCGADRIRGGRGDVEGVAISTVQGNYTANANGSINGISLTTVSASGIYAGLASVSGIATATATGRFPGENWNDVPIGSNAWNDVTVGANTWADVAVSSNSWDNVPKGSNTWTDVAKDKNTWLQLG